MNAFLIASLLLVAVIEFVVAGLGAAFLNPAVAVIGFTGGVLVLAVRQILVVVVDIAEQGGRQTANPSIQSADRPAADEDWQAVARRTGEPGWKVQERMASAKAAK